MTDVVQIAVLGFKTTRDPKENLSIVEKYISSAKDRGAQWIFLPELWTHRSQEQNEFVESSKYVSDTMLDSVGRISKKYQVTIFAGSWTEVSDHASKFYNTQYVLDPTGECVGKYRKIHLFAIQDGGGEGYAETKRYVAGKTPVKISYNGWNIGLSTCFDLRFPSLYEELGREGPLDMITVPSGFLERTGKYHWETLLRARAIEHQCYVVAANKVGIHEDPRIDKFYGHSMIIDPWGEVVTDSQNETGAFLATISKKKIQDVRNTIPMREIKACKKDLY